MSPINIEETHIKNQKATPADSARATDWYVVQVVGGQEQIVRRLILNRFAGGGRELSESMKKLQEMQTPSPYLIEECFIPMRERKIKYRGKWQLVKERILPGYVFIVTKNPEQVFQSLKQIPRFTSLLGNTDAGFIPLNEQEVHFLSRFGNSEHVSHLSQVTVEAGNKVRILEGDLLNYEGEIVKVNLHKRVAIVRVPFMGSSVDVHLGIEIVEKVDIGK